MFPAHSFKNKKVALFGLARDSQTLIISAVEHSSVMGAADELARRGAQVVKLPVTRDGKGVRVEGGEVLIPLGGSGLVEIEVELGADVARRYAARVQREREREEGVER